MKKIILMFLFSVLLISCNQEGKQKLEKTSDNTSEISDTTSEVKDQNDDNSLIEENANIPEESNSEESTPITEENKTEETK